QAAVDKPSGRAIVQSQVEGASTPSADSSYLFVAGLLIYVIAVGACLWSVNWEEPLDNKFILVVLAAANLPLIILFASRGKKVDFSGKVALIQEGIAWGGSSVAIVILLMLLTSWMGANWSRAGVFGHRASVQTERAALEPTDRNADLMCI